MNEQLVFVGEKRSGRAIAMGVRWTDRRLASRTLHEALEAAGVGTASLLFANLFCDGEGWNINQSAVRRLRQLAAEGTRIVGLGKRVQRQLGALGVEHLKLTHPAARGAIRRRDRYHAHVAEVLRRPETAS